MSKKKIVFLTGAGMSVESGLETFRDADGLWAKYRIENVCTPEALRANPDLVREFYNMRREEIAKVKPNNGHLAIAELEKEYDVVVVTQNIDDLHERAGSSNIVHLHGEAMKCASVSNPYKPLPLPDGRLALTKEDVDANGIPLRPFVVFFGESVPKLDEGIQHVLEADIFVVVGTSLNVYPAAGLVHYAKPGTPIFLIDPKEVVMGGLEFTHFRCGSSEGMQLLVAKLEQLKQHS
ncbi:MAG: Sir2 family NAD-dependent protein deacetylase [Porphyromonas sp.]|nr:Sir2 family NAD-dependent protein deacetylase [Porphyromonas sp.]